VTIVLLSSLSCRQPECLDLEPPKPPGLPIFAGDRLDGARLLHVERPLYPAGLRHLGTQTVRLRGTILEDGTVIDISYMTGPPQLFPFARAAAARWRYEPVRLFNPFAGKSDLVRIFTVMEMRFEP
jgi:hypothetical protein